MEVTAHGGLSRYFGDPEETIMEHTKDHKLLHGTPHDPYLDSQRPAGAAQCPHCTAVYHGGHWHWPDADTAAALPAHTCPACRRIADGAEAGRLVLSGGFVSAHRSEIISLLQHTEAREKSEHPLERLIALRDEGETLIVTTTGTHLANRMGHALEAAWDGTCTYRYNDSEVYLDVTWQRN